MDVKRLWGPRIARRHRNRFQRVLPPRTGSLRRSILRLEPLERRELLAVVAWTGAATTQHNLGTPADNWSKPQVPREGDEVSMPSGTVIVSNQSSSLHSLENHGQSVLAGSPQPVLQTAAFTNHGIVTLSGSSA